MSESRNEGVGGTLNALAVRLKEYPWNGGIPMKSHVKALVVGGGAVARPSPIISHARDGRM